MTATTPARWLCLLILASVSTTVAGAGILPSIPEDPRFDRLTVDDGLPNNTVWDIERAQSGFLWLGTMNGLARFDGYEMVVFRPILGDSTSISSRDVRVLCQDLNGKLWIGSRDGGLDYLDPRTNSFGRPEPVVPQSSPHRLPAVVDIDVAPDSTVWVASPDAGLWRHDRVRDVLIPVATVGDQMLGQPPDSLTALLAAADGSVWVGVQNRGLAIYNPAAQTWRYLPPLNRNYGPEPDRIEDLFQDSSGMIWVAAHSGFFQWDSGADCLKVCRRGNSGGCQDRSFSIDEDIDGAIWVGTENGLMRIDPERNTCRRFTNVPGGTETLAAGPKLGVHCDQTGTVWCGGWQEGVSVLDPWRNTFTLLDHTPGDPGSIDRNTVTCMLEDSRGSLWVGTGGESRSDRGGLNRRRNGDEHFEHLVFSGESEISSVQSLLEAPDGKIWVGTNEGLWTLPLGGSQPVRPRTGEPLASRIADVSVFALACDLDGHIWVGTRGDGIHQVNRRTGMITEYRHDPSDPSSLSGNRVIELYRDTGGRMWVGTEASGLNLFLPSTQTFKRFRDTTLGLNMITGLASGNDDDLYVATSAGLFLVDPQGDIKVVDDPSGYLFDQSIVSLVDGTKDDLWAHTSRGIVHLNATGESQIFDRCSGVPPGGYFMEGSRGRDGTLYFGSQKGMVVVYPDRIKAIPFDMPSIITGLRVAGRAWPGANTAAETTVLPFVDRISLSHDQNDLDFTFISLCLLRPEHTRFRYRLDGADNDWHVAGEYNHANYTNLAPGSYTLQVQSRRTAGSWSPHTASVDVLIAPPWWQQIWFRVLYVVVGLGLVLLVHRLVVNRERMRLALELERGEARHLQELDSFKSRFFANISHEFRTPLTLINVPLGRLIDGASGNERHVLERIKRNATRLGHLIEQLLALSRLEVGRLPVHWENRDAVAVVRGLAANFATMARDRSIRYEIEVPDEDLVTWFDPDILDKILVNLLSNAFKFTPDTGRIRVTLTVDEEVEECEPPVPDGANFDSQPTPARMVEIYVVNSGSYIPPDRHEQIFDRYQQLASSDMTTGSGIGLALVRELVELMGGSVEVTSDLDVGTRFTVMLPFFLVAPPAATELADNEEGAASDLSAMGSDVDDEDDNQESAKEQPRVLIVEDNADMRAFVSEELAGEYDCTLANNGESGLARALEDIPDLVISDLAMPGMDGFQLCRQLKQDDRTSHVPLILLTGRSETTSRLEGLTIGADDYLTKPFEPEELRIRVANLIEQRRRLQTRFARRIVNLEPAAMPVSSADERFLLRARRVIEEHVSEPEFSVVMFSRELGVSQPHLLRKLKALTGLTPQVFIRTHRLQRAAKLLEDGYGNVTEVAYAVGLLSLSTFAKRFKEQYGVLPSKYPQQHDATGD